MAYKKDIINACQDKKECKLFIFPLSSLIRRPQAYKELGTLGTADILKPIQSHQSKSSPIGHLFNIYFLSICTMTALL